MLVVDGIADAAGQAVVPEAAVLCPSFYRADIIHNPTGFDRLLARLRGGIIGFLQRRRDRRRLALV